MSANRQRYLFGMATSVWWPGNSLQLKTFAHQCSTCAGLYPLQRTYAAFTTSQASLGKGYIQPVCVQGQALCDYLSSTFWCCINIHTLSWSHPTQCHHLCQCDSDRKFIFSWHGSSHTVVNDSGPNYVHLCLLDLQLNHVTSKPNHQCFILLTKYGPSKEQNCSRATHVAII